MTYTWPTLRGTNMFTDRPSREDLDPAEDKRLRRLGIDPIGDPVDFIIHLRKKQAELEREKEEKRQKLAG